MRLKYLFILIIFVLLISCNNEEESANLVFDEVADEIVDSLFTVQTNLDRTERIIRAKRIRRYYNQDISIADSLTITDFDELGKLKYKIYCDSAHIDNKKKLFEAHKNVVVTNPEAILKTDLLIWNQKTNDIHAPDSVTVFRKNSVLRGMDLRTDMNLDNLEMKKVKAKGDLREEDIEF